MQKNCWKIQYDYFCSTSVFLLFLYKQFLSLYIRIYRCSQFQLDNNFPKIFVNKNQMMAIATNFNLRILHTNIWTIQVVTVAIIPTIYLSRVHQI